MTDLVVRLREVADREPWFMGSVRQDLRDAADEIDGLRRTPNTSEEKDRG